MLFKFEQNPPSNLKVPNTQFLGLNIIVEKTLNNEHLKQKKQTKQFMLDITDLFKKVPVVSTHAIF